MQLLKQRTPQPLGGGTEVLSRDTCRVDREADVGHHDQALDVDLAGLGVDGQGDPHHADLPEGRELGEVASPSDHAQPGHLAPTRAEPSRDHVRV